jgi:hypothetical protein
VSLPGVSLYIQDKFLGISRTNVPIGPRIAIIGRRNSVFEDQDGRPYQDNSAVAADLDPFSAQNEREVIERYGVGSDLHRGYVEAQLGGARFIYLIALPEDTEFNHTLGTISSATYTAEVGSNTLFVDAFAAAEAVRVDIIVPWGRGAGPTEFQSPATPADDEEVGFHADNSNLGTSSWAYQAAYECARITADSHPCFAVLGIAPYMDSSTADGGMTPAQTAGHLALPNLPNREDEVLRSYGPYVSVVATEVTPLRYNRLDEWGFANGAATYAGAISQLDSWSAPTAKPIANIERVRYNPTRTQQLALVEKGIVPISLNFQRNATWVDGQTFARTGSDYRRLTTLRTVYDAVLLIRQVAQRYIGEGSNSNTRNALETSITSGLRGMQQLGALLASDFTVSYVPIENKAIIDLVLQPAFELRNIEVRVSVQL